MADFFVIHPPDDIPDPDREDYWTGDEIGIATNEKPLKRSDLNPAELARLEELEEQEGLDE
jgi:hypothetical protein